MYWNRLWSLTAFVLMYFVIHVDPVFAAHVPKLILISMDSFRYNYLDTLPENQTENFHYFIKNGIKAEYVQNVFPSVTYPNHYTMITGLYPESHGLVHNEFYDPFWKEYFSMRNKRDNFDSIWYDNGAEPIYVTNNRAGSNRKTGSMLWPAGLAKVKGVAPDRLVPGEFSFSNMSFYKRVDLLMSWFTAEDPINLGLLYFPEPDELGHKYGPASKEVRDIITGELNDVLGYLLKKLKAAGILKETHIILTADHGMSEAKKDVVLENLNPAWYFTGSPNPHRVTVDIFPTNDSYLERIYSAVSKSFDINVYRKGHRKLKDLHYNDNRRIAPLVIVANEGFAIYMNKSEHTKHEKKESNKGMHGYDPYAVKNMHPFFLAVGPAFKAGLKSEPFDLVDIYPLMCHILGIEPAPNNGSLDRVKHLLNVTPANEAGANPLTAVSFLIIIGFCASVSGAFAICTCHHARHQPRRLTRLVTFGSEYHRTGTIRQATTQGLLQSEDEDDEF